MRRDTVTHNRAKALRKQMSEPEVILWSRLRSRNSDRPSFRRQHPCGAFILDFFCPSARLAIEVDGSTHWDEATRVRDAARDAWLARQGVAVLRIPASRIYHDLPSVVDAIILAALDRRRSVRA